ncbi:MAG: triose-phosphate isomerase [Deltaproteobacteria bacterium]|nr:triose-phosphate isomerase [Deltaproteobacteria bacterium]
MNKVTKEAIDFVEKLNAAWDRLRGVDVVVAPAFPLIGSVARRLKDPFGLAAQNVHSSASGAFTGEVSAKMLVDVGCEFVLVGHSERRVAQGTTHAYGIGESDDEVGRKLKSAQSAGLVPILCVGEQLVERDRGETEARLNAQLAAALDGVSIASSRELVIAYEPVWAIGTGKNATPEQAEKAHHYIRARLADRFGAAIAAHLRILYGGSVKPDNVVEIGRCPDVNGALVGGASLDVEAFVAIGEGIARARERKG